MYLIPLNQIESVDLVIHALRAAAGEADCTMCPVRKVCTKQCLALADGIQQMVTSNNLPTMDFVQGQSDDSSPEDPDGSDGPAAPGGGSHLRIVK